MRAGPRWHRPLACGGPLPAPPRTWPTASFSGLRQAAWPSAMFLFFEKPVSVSIKRSFGGKNPSSKSINFSMITFFVRHYSFACSGPVKKQNFGPKV